MKHFKVAAALAAMAPAGLAPRAPVQPQQPHLIPQQPRPLPQQQRPVVPAPAQAAQHRSPEGAGITAGLFQQAMQQALIGSQLQQLRDMGFTNEEENRRALAATNGNVEAALEWIINERERMEQQQ